MHSGIFAGHGDIMLHWSLPKSANVLNVDSSCFDSWDKTIGEFRAKTSRELMELERESVKSAEKADTDEGGEISSEKLT